MFGFKDFLKERYVSIGVRSPHHTKIVSDLEKMDKTSKIIFRGFHKTSRIATPRDTILVSSMKDASGEWYGLDFVKDKKLLSSSIKELVHDMMGIKYPVFATNNASNAWSFGDPGILIPRGKATYWYSEKITDILLDMNNEFIEEGVESPSLTHSKKSAAARKSLAKEITEKYFKGYSKISNSPKINLHEIIIDTPEYWYIPVSYLRIIYGDDVVQKHIVGKTYKDLLKLLEKEPSHPEKDIDKVPKKRFE